MKRGAEKMKGFFFPQKNIDVGKIGILYIFLVLIKIHGSWMWSKGFILGILSESGILIF